VKINIAPPKVPSCEDFIFAKVLLVIEEEKILPYILKIPGEKQIKYIYIYIIDKN
jgi:hypothetical protein